MVMARHYPYLSDKKKKKDIVCDTCKNKGEGFELEWQVSWFRGEDEYEKICKNCLAKRDAEQKIKDAEDQKRWRVAAAKQEKFWNDMKRRLEENYEVQYLTDYQWRINGTIDIYPTNRRYHNLKTQERGDYRDMHSFLRKQFAK
jgi:hypothetical protein